MLYFLCHLSSQAISIRRRVEWWVPICSCMPYAGLPWNNKLLAQPNDKCHSTAVRPDLYSCKTYESSWRREHPLTQARQVYVIVMSWGLTAAVTFIHPCGGGQTNSIYLRWRFKTSHAAGGVYLNLASGNEASTPSEPILPAKEGIGEGPQHHTPTYTCKALRRSSRSSRGPPRPGRTLSRPRGPTQSTLLPLRSSRVRQKHL